METTDIKIIPTKAVNIILFIEGDKKQELLKICSNGDMFVKGNLVENDKEVINALREFLTNQRFAFIKPAKDSWNRKEVIILLEKCFETGMTYERTKTNKFTSPSSNFKDWIRENL